MVELTSVTAAVQLAHKVLDTKLEQIAMRLFDEQLVAFFEAREKQAGD